MKNTLHPSNSQTQREAQDILLSLAAPSLPAKWLKPEPGKKTLRINLSSTAYVEVDGQSVDPPVLAEVYASPRHSGLLSGQKKKLATDILKLITVRQAGQGWSAARCVLLFSSNDAANGVTGWVREAARIWNIELIVVEGIDEALDEMLSAAQHVQAWMSEANPD